MTNQKKSSSSKASSSSKTAKSRTSKPKNKHPLISIFIKLSLVLFVVLVVYCIFLDMKVVEQFAGRKWSVPAKVYARPLEMYAGRQLSPNIVRSELQRLNYRNTGNLNKPGSFFLQGSTLVLRTRGFQFWDGYEASAQYRITWSGEEITEVVRDANAESAQQTAGILRLEPSLIGGVYPKSQEDRSLIRLDQAPEFFLKTLIAVEDRDFYDHFGISPRGILRAAWVNLTAGSVRQGGSTLTQQLVKNFFLTSERSIQRKVQEALMALLLERHATKDEILEAYLNEVFLGQQGARAIHGVGLASEYYFGVPLQELNLSQQALLVGMIKGPSYYNPRRNTERALQRRDQVLDVVAETGLLPQAEINELKKENLDVMAQPVFATNRFPAFLDLVKRQLRRDYEEEDLSSEGLKIFTTMDPQAQEAAEISLSTTLNKMDATGKNLLQGAVVITEPNSGEVLAMVGDRQPTFPGYNRALDAKRQIGSIAKPAVYLAGLASGFNLASILEDEPITITDPQRPVGEQDWTPKNYDKKNHGPTLLVDALAHSYNQSTVYLGMQVGVDRVAEIMRQASKLDKIPRYPSIFLGAVEMTPIEVNMMFQTFAAAGFSAPPRAIREVLDQMGEPLARYPLKVEQVFEPADMYLLNYALKQVMAFGTGASVYRNLPRSLEMAGKTGTTDDLRDSWFAGMMGDYVATVWVGRDDNGQTGLTGATGALKVWTEIIAKLPQRPLIWNQPELIEVRAIDPASGGISDTYCQGVINLPMRRDRLPERVAPCYGSESKPSWLNRWFPKLNKSDQQSKQGANGAQKSEKRPEKSEWKPFW
ncbi:MAG: penicillin-binding protein 1B [Pseudomonadota bacterium]